MSRRFLVLAAVLSLDLRVGLTPARAATEITIDSACGPCGRSTDWDEFDAVDMKTTASALRGHAAWRVRFDKASSDLQIDVEMSDGEQTKTGRILLIGGRVMAASGPIVEEGFEVDALDGPILEWKLVRQLLGRSLPGGPQSVEGSREIDFTDEKVGIQFATPSAEGYIAPPWRVTGSVTVVSTDVVEFDLRLSVSGKASPAGLAEGYVQTIAGRLKVRQAARIDDATSLKGWKVYGLGPQRRKQGDATIVDYGAGVPESEFKRVADVRRWIEADEFPGIADPSKDFTGFWKTSCENPFGLRIMPYGADGKYSVVFCGPGGCGSMAQRGTVTFITQDPHFKVVTDDELEIQGNDATWNTHHRCTRETHPVLKYTSG